MTTPLDLWVHGLMGVEERIGTCTADAVLMESSATHYEREYGPGVHAAELAVYTGSLYQSNRSSFRPLMRVKSGVRNLIAGGDGGDGGGVGSAGSAPGASPPPVPSQAGAVEESATGTLAAGRRTAKTPATALDTAHALTDARGGEELGEAGVVVHVKNLPELTRSTDTAVQLRALQETLRMDATRSASESAGGFRASEAEADVSKLSAAVGGGPLEISRPSAIYGENATMVRPHPGVERGQRPKMKLEHLDGADRAPRSAAPEPDFLEICRRLRDICDFYTSLSMMDTTNDFQRAVDRVRQIAMRQYETLGWRVGTLSSHAPDMTMAEQAYRVLQDAAHQAEIHHNFARAREIRRALESIDRTASSEWENLTMTYGALDALTTQAMQLPPATGAPPAAAPSTTMPPIERLQLSDPPHPIVPRLDLAFPEPAGGPGRGRLDPPPTASSTAPAPGAPFHVPPPVVDDFPIERSLLSGPLPAADDIPPAPRAPSHGPSPVDDALPVESALLSGRLPPGFNASRLIAGARRFPELGLARALEAGTLTLQTIDQMIRMRLVIGTRPGTDVDGSNAVHIAFLRHMKARFESAMRDAYPWRSDPRWLDHLRAMLRQHDSPHAPNPASAASLPDLDPTEIDRILATGEGALHPAPLPPPEAPGGSRAGPWADDAASARASPWTVDGTGCRGGPLGGRRGGYRGGRWGASPRRQPVAHPTAGDGRGADPGRHQPLFRAPRPRQTGPLHRDDTPCGNVGRRTAGVAERRDARLRPSGRGRRRAPVPAPAPRGNCPPVQVRARVARRAAQARGRPCRGARLDDQADARRARRPRPTPPRYRPIELHGRRGDARHRLERD